MTDETTPLEEIPAEYSTARLKFVVERQTDKFDDVPEDVPRITLDMVESWTGKVNGTDDDEKASSGLVKFNEGDVLFNKLRPYLAKGFVAENSGAASPEFIVLRPTEFSARYLLYLLLSREFIDRVDASTYGAKMPRASWDFIGSVRIPHPDEEKQEMIADFLGHHTSRIDALVEKSNRLLELLTDKRNYVINRTLTLGVDSDKDYKPSDSPLRDQIPERWDLAPLKYSTPNITVGIVQKPSQYYVTSGIPALRSLNVKPGQIIEDDFVYISEEANLDLGKSRLRTGDLVSVRSGDPGTTAVVPDRLDGANCIDLIIIREPTAYVSEYLCHLMNSRIADKQFRMQTEGAAQQHFNVEDAKNLVFPRPPLDEQKSILNHLSKNLSPLDQLETKIQKSITLLQEKRQALITNAVTGQIDLSDWQLPDEREATT